MKPVEQSQKLGDSFEVAVKNGLMAALCAKSFPYLEEGESKKGTPKLNDWELASRLSYFLWSSKPDQQLLELARSGKLHEAETLRTEVRRMARSQSDGVHRELRRPVAWAPRHRRHAS